MPRPHKHDAGLIFLGSTEITPRPALDLIEDVFREYGQSPEDVSHLSDTRDLVIGNSLAADVKIRRGITLSEANLDCDDVEGPVTLLQTSLMMHDEDHPLKEDLMLEILNDFLARSVTEYDPDFVTWFDLGTVVPTASDETEDGLPDAQLSRRSSLPVPASQRFEPVAVEEDRLMNSEMLSACDDTISFRFSRAVRTDPVRTEQTEANRPSAAIRLATWALTGTVATLSFPVASAVAIVCLARGEDFRLATQALSVTGLMVSLNSSGAMAAATTLLPH